MLVLGYAGHRRHGWTGDVDRKLKSRLRHSMTYPTYSARRRRSAKTSKTFRSTCSHSTASAMTAPLRSCATAASSRRPQRSASPGSNMQRDPVEIPFRRAASAFCLTQAGASIDDVEHIAFYCDFTPDALRQRIDAIRPHLSADVAERVFAAYRVVHEGTVSNDRIAEEIAELFEHRSKAMLHFVPHHLAHAACAFYSSGFAESGILTIDGFGEKSSSVFALGERHGIRVVEETMLPGSLGVLYMMMTAYLGFKPLDGEYKVMGLASYGTPKTYARQFEALFEEVADGTCRTTALARGDFGERMKNLLGPARKPLDPVGHREMDIAAALQQGFEDAMLRRLAYLKTTYGIERICLAGGAPSTW